MKIAIGSDHAGFEYKEKIKAYLTSQEHQVKDFGTDSTQMVDYPLFIRPVALAVSRGEAELGIVLGGSGNGEAIVANRIPGVRCVVCWNIDSAKMGAAHNKANVISLGQRMIPETQVIPIVDAWLKTSFEGGRHERRIAMIDDGLPTQHPK